MPDSLVPTGRELRARFVADPASVPGVRGFVADGLRAWGREALVDDAMLCVSELAGNAALHSASTFMEVAVRAGRDNIRISVEDDGPVPADSVTPRLTISDLGIDCDILPEDEPTTGRGLTIVSFLASDWGVDHLARGKRVWAVLAENPEDEPLVATPRQEQSAAVRPDEEALPEGWVHFVLKGTPIELFLRESRHLDELVRELQLIAHDTDNPEAPALAARLQGLLATPAQARNAARRIAEEARQQHRDRVDMRIPVPRSFSDALLEIHEALDAADLLCDEMRLLTLSSPSDVRALREWMLDEAAGQVDRGAPPVPWDEWRDHRG